MVCCVLIHSEGLSVLSRPRACPSLTSVENASLPQTFCQQALLGQWALRGTPAPQTGRARPRSVQSEAQARAPATGFGPGWLRIMCLAGPSICHLALQAQDKIHFLLGEPMICFSHVSFPDFFFLIRNYSL